ncbi:hypothetical protein HZS_6928 [Henneguya salminicola]|nr:hypothetical protein HZS_6928 [Henneguya salminicola]
MCSNIIYKGFSYHKINISGNTIYYICIRPLTDMGEARLIFKNDIITGKGNATSKPIKSTTIEIPRLEISSAHFLAEFVNEKPFLFKDYPYNIPSKDTIFSKITTLRETQDLSTTQGVRSQPACYKKNGQPFFTRLWTGDIHNEYNTTMIWTTNETLALLRFNSHFFIDNTFKIHTQRFFTMSCHHVA